MRKRGNILPHRGGCWFCYNDDGEMHFTAEWDAYFHKQCLLDALEDEKKRGLDDWESEAKIIKEEFKIWF